MFTSQETEANWQNNIKNTNKQTQIYCVGLHMKTYIGLDVKQKQTKA